MRRNSMKLLQAMFSETPETLNPVDMVRASGKLILSVIDSVMLRVANINESGVTTPSIRMDNCLKSKATANNSLKRGLRAVRHDLRIDFAVRFQQTEDRSLATGSSASLASNSSSTEVRFINFDFAGNGEARSASSAIRSLILRKIIVTALPLMPVSSATSVAEKSMAK